MQNEEDSPLFHPRLKSPTLSPCKSSAKGFIRTPLKTQEALYPSIIHNTPERKKYSAAEWDAFTKESTEKALEELVASPDFGKWFSSNAGFLALELTVVFPLQKILIPCSGGFSDLVSDADHTG
ncbi:hypothetical protein LR48_Vigan50s004100 [Vigna angularis]|nr:hypothetical protein LR48_Vigan50s004100 [Vigna angularis]